MFNGGPSMSHSAQLEEGIARATRIRRYCREDWAWRPSLPARPKLLQRNSLQRKCFGTIKFVKNYKRITLQSKFLGLFSCKKGHTSSSNITKKIFWWNIFCNNYKNYYKRKCSKELFCNNFGQDGIELRKEKRGFVFRAPFLDSWKLS